MKFYVTVAFLLSHLPFMPYHSEQATEQVQWQSWDIGYPQGIEDRKIILIDTYTAWCGWCKKMDKDTYAHQEVVEKINKHFVPIKFNPELPQKYELNGKQYSGFELKKMLSNNQRLGYPTTYFLIPHKNRIIIDPGYRGPEEFLKILDDVIKQAQ